LIYKKITLITSTQIIKQIFTLVCNKLSVNLEIYPDDTNISKTDILIYEDINFDKDSLIRYKSMCSSLGVIAKKKVYEYEGCYLIKKPFLPSSLVNNISELIDNIKPVKVIEKKIEDMSGEVDDLVDFIDTIDYEKNEPYEDSDDLEIDANTLGYGGVLDKNELSKLHDIISEDSISEFGKIDDIQDDGDWLELNDIIDNVIDDISESKDEIINEKTEKNDSNEILLVLNKFTMDELSALLNKLDQSCIDKLSAGNDVQINLRLEQ